jgi:glycosyltransferase involved in cell wall biosynthesis
MNNKYYIYWLLNASIDKKSSISPRIEMLNELYQLGNDVTLIASTNKESKNRPKLKYNIKIEYLEVISVPMISRIHFNISCLFSFQKRKNFPEKETVLIVDQHNIYSALLVKMLSLINKKREVKVHFDLRTIPVVTKGLKGFLRKVVVWYPAILFAKYFADSFSFITSEIEENVKFRKKACTWSSGVNLDQFQIEKYNINKSKQRVLFYHGVVTVGRGLRETIRAIENVKDEIRDLKFIIVGDGADFAKIKKMVKDNNLDAYVKFTGKVDYTAIAQYIASAEVCICPLPDYLEWRVSSPLKVLEYISMGKPCILTKINPHLKLFQDNTQGIYWAGKGSAKDISKAIIDAFNDEHKKRYYKNLRIIAESHSWKNKASILNHYWDDVFSSPTSLNVVG